MRYIQLITTTHIENNALQEVNKRTSTSNSNLIIMLNELICCRFGKSDRKGDFQKGSNNEYIVQKKNIF